MLRSFAHTVACWYVLLGVIAQSFKSVKRLTANNIGINACLICLHVRSFKLTSVPRTSKTSEFESKRLLSDAVYFLKKLNLKGKSHEVGVCEPKRNAWKILHIKFFTG